MELREVNSTQNLKLQEEIDGLEEKKQGFDGCHLIFKIYCSAQKQNQEMHTEHKQQDLHSSKVNGHRVMAESLLMETLPQYTPLEPNQLDTMSREEMMSKILELEEMEKFHRAKIGELSGNLGTLRQAVEVVAITMETDADLPVVNVRPKGKVRSVLKPFSHVFNQAYSLMAS